MDWFFDWDGTMTTADTLSILASIGYNRNTGSGLLPWSCLVEAYRSDYEAHAMVYEPYSPDMSLQRTFSWQRSLVAVERNSVERVERAGIFANLTEADVDNGAHDAMQTQAVSFRSGLGSLLDCVARSGGRICIISINWSARFIQGCLKSLPGLLLSDQDDHIEILANEIDYSDGTGKMSRVFSEEDHGIWTAHDKAQVLQGQLSKHVNGHTSTYVGDSPGDLQCLLKAEIGICIREESRSSEQQALVELLVNLDIPCCWIGEYKVSQDGQSTRPLWWARDFQDISDYYPLIACSPASG